MCHNNPRDLVTQVEVHQLLRWAYLGSERVIANSLPWGYMPPGFCWKNTVVFEASVVPRTLLSRRYGASC